MKRLNSRMTVMVWVMVAYAMMPAVTLGQMQIPGVGSMLPDKTQLLEQAQKLVSDLTSMKTSGKLGGSRYREGGFTAAQSYRGEH